MVQESEKYFSHFMRCHLSDRKPAGGVRHTQLRELVLQHSQDDSIKSRAELQHRSLRNPGAVGLSGGKCFMHCLHRRLVDSVGKLQWVQKWVDDSLEVRQYKILK